MVCGVVRGGAGRGVVGWGGTPHLISISIVISDMGEIILIT